MLVKIALICKRLRSLWLRRYNRRPAKKIIAIKAITNRVNSIRLYIIGNFYKCKNR